MKKTLLVCVSILLVAVFAIGGTLAYLTDTDSAVNVMTVGNVKIEQLEKDKEGKDFEQNQMLLPAVENQDGSFKNVIEKHVSVKNTGNSDAYIRTIFAFEGKPFMGKENTDDELAYNKNSKVHVVRNSDSDIEWKFIDDIKIGNSDYQIVLATYMDPVGAGISTVESLQQIYLDPLADNADLAKYGEKYTVFAISQAVQAEGFDNAKTALNTAFGEITADYNPWAADTSWYNDTANEFTLTTPQQLLGFAKLVNAEGNSFAGKTIKLGADIDLDGYGWEPIGQANDVNNNNDALGRFYGTFDGQNHTISNMTVNYVLHDIDADYAVGFFGFTDSNATIKNVKFDNASVTGYHYAGVVIGYMTGKIDNCTVTNSDVTSVHLDNNDRCGDKAGMIAGIINGGSTVSNCKAENCTVTAGRDAGQLVGCKNGEVNNITDCTATNVAVSATGDCTGNNIKNDLYGRS